MTVLRHRLAGGDERGCWEYDPGRRVLLLRVAHDGRKIDLEVPVCTNAAPSANRWVVVRRAPGHWKLTTTLWPGTIADVARPVPFHGLLPEAPIGLALAPPDVDAEMLAMAHPLGPQLASLRLSLEHARIALREAPCPEGKVLHADVSEAIRRIASIESGAVADPTSEKAAGATSIGRELIALASHYCARNRIYFRGGETPSPHSSTRAFSRADIDAIMRPGATSPPPEVASAIAEAQLVEELPSLPPEEDTGMGKKR